MDAPLSDAGVGKEKIMDAPLAASSSFREGPARISNSEPRRSLLHLFAPLTLYHGPPNVDRHNWTKKYEETEPWISSGRTEVIVYPFPLLSLSRSLSLFLSLTISTFFTRVATFSSRLPHPFDYPVCRKNDSPASIAHARAFFLKYSKYRVLGADISRAS